MNIDQQRELEYCQSQFQYPPVKNSGIAAAIEHLKMSANFYREQGYEWCAKVCDHEISQLEDILKGEDPWEPEGALARVNHTDHGNPGYRIIGWRIKDDGTPLALQMDRLDAK